MQERKEIIVNLSYQRSSGVWPLYAQSYFIDTILEGFTFPKIYFYQNLDKQTRKPIKEIVDGQQRLHAIKEFALNKLKLGPSSKNYSGYKYSDLPEDKQNEFLMYSVSTDVILSASKTELLEMFRRINAYTAPLNDAEKRHSKYQGEFKWFVTDLSDRYTSILKNYNILTDKQIIRMYDAELFTEFALVLDSGITSKSSPKLDNIYKKYDEKFENINKWKTLFSSFFNVIVNDFKDLKNTFIFKSYTFYSLFTALIHAKYGIPDGDKSIGFKTLDKFYIDKQKCLDILNKLAEAHELQDIKGKYADYVNACLSTTTNANQRSIRAKFIYKALRGDEIL